MELRKTEKFKVMHANTGRLEKSSIIYMQHLLNQLTWNKKIILFGRDSRNPRFNEIAQSCMHFLINLVVPSLWIWVVRYIIWNKPYSLTRSLKYCCQIWIFLATRFPGCTTICRSGVIILGMVAVRLNRNQIVSAKNKEHTRNKVSFLVVDPGWTILKIIGYWLGTRFQDFFDSRVNHDSKAL